MHAVFNAVAVAHQFKIEKAETFTWRSLKLGAALPAETGCSRALTHAHGSIHSVRYSPKLAVDSTISASRKLFTAMTFLPTRARRYRSLTGARRYTPST